MYLQNTELGYTERAHLNENVCITPDIHTTGVNMGSAVKGSQPAGIPGVV